MKQQKTSGAGKKQKRQAAREEIVQQTQIRRVPVVEIRKPATLAQALTEPRTAVIKPVTRVTRKITRRVA